MKITEQNLNDTILNLQEDSKSPTTRFEQHSNQFPALTAFLFSDDLDMLSEGEKSLMMFMGDIIFSAWTKYVGKKVDCSVEDVEEILSSVANTWDSASSMDDKMDSMFEDEQEIELLAFVEDLTSEEEEISFTGKSAIVITLKTIIQGLQLQ